MQKFPRFKPFHFEFQGSEVVSKQFEGRLDLIARSIYGVDRLYKPLAAANNIRMVLGCRLGIRPTPDAIEKDRQYLGLDSNYVNNYLDDHVPGDNEWFRYGDTRRGMFTDVYAGRILLVPSLNSAKAWMIQYDQLGD